MNVIDPKIQEYVKKNGVKAQKVLMTLNKNRQLVNALSTPLGQELMADVLRLAEVSLESFISMDIDKSNEKWLEARADYRSAMKLVNKFLEKINRFQSDLETVTQ
jgi:hypothetical protein